MARKTMRHKRHNKKQQHTKKYKKGNAYKEDNTYKGGDTPILLSQTDDSSLREDSLREKGVSYKSPLKSSPKWDYRVDYLELMQSYIDSQNDIIKDLQKKINQIPSTMRKNTGGERYYEILAIMRNMMMLTNKDYLQNYVKTIPKTEEKALKNLRTIFRDQINFLSLKSKIELELSKLNIENKTPKGNIVNIQTINSLRKIDNKINFATASRIVESMKKQGLKFTKKNMKRQLTQNVKDENV